MPASWKAFWLAGWGKLVPASGTGNLHFAGSGSAVVVVPATGTGNLHFSGAGTAVVVVPASGTGNLHFAGSAAAVVVEPTSGSGHLTFAGSGTAVVPHIGAPVTAGILVASGMVGVDLAAGNRWS